MHKDLPTLGIIEGQHVELKGAFSWNSIKGCEDGDMRLGTARSIAAFANSNGGRLIIGASDDGRIHGIDVEITSLFKDNNLDRFQNLIHEHLKNVLFPYPFRSYQISFEQHSTLWICCINVSPCPGITYVKTKANNGKTEHTIYVRTGNRTVKVTDLDRDRMIVDRFGGKWSL